MASVANGSNASNVPGNKLDLKNRAGESRSPYVRGHANNPVPWQLWDPATLALAKTHNKLLFVSIGYAACHWCHVMERESFENDSIASLLNTSFIPIKIDREERPDIDRIYMNYVQATTGHGGWPLNVFLTPDLQPIFGGTYFPGPDSQMAKMGQGMGFGSLLERVQMMWMTQRERCLNSAKDVTEQLKEFAQEGNLGGLRMGDDGDGLELELLEDAYDHFATKYDSVNGGFGSEPKFPTPANLAFLLTLGQFPGAVRDVVGHVECSHAATMVLKTLRHMTRGGIHDQVGNGFARYSVTKDWSLPHFEKMLYDQVQLLNLYLDAFLLTGEAEMLGTVYSLSSYLTSPPLAAPCGGFYSSEDADSFPSYSSKHKIKHEGAFYVWTRAEFDSVIGNERDANIAAKFYNVKKHGNVDPEHDAHDELTSQNVLAIVSCPEALAKEFQLSKEEIVKLLKDVRSKLRSHREKERPRPDLDDKIVVAWNGLAISALARVSSALTGVDDEKADECRNAAVKAVEFIRKELYDEDTGKMWRVYREGRGDAPALCEDYAFFIQGLCDLYEATWDDAYLQLADELMKTQLTLFTDSSSSHTTGFFSTASSQPDILLRLKDGMDNAEPSTNGISCLNLFRLSSYLSDAHYEKLAKETLAAFATEMSQHPFLFPSLLTALVSERLGVRSIVLTGDTAATQDAVTRVRARVRPNTTVVRLGDGAKWDWLVKRNELLKAMDPLKPRAQICEQGVCKEILEMGQVEGALRWGGEDGEGEGKEGVELSRFVSVS